jgi:DNA replication protein DnaC
MSDRIYKDACVPLRHSKFRPVQSTDANWISTYEKLKEDIETGFLGALVGTRGTGKTQLAACLIGHCTLNLVKSALYTKAFEIFVKIRSGYKLDEESEDSALRRYLNPYLLVIDAYEVRSESAFENRVINHIIDKRYDGMKSTIIISNDTVDSFEDVIGLSICDRMRETGGIIEMKWDSFRLK